MGAIKRLVLWIVGTGLVGGVALWIMDAILDGLVIRGFGSFVIGAMLISGLTAAVAPFVFRFAVLLHPIIFPFLIFPITALTVWIAAEIDDALDIGYIQIDDLWTAIWISVGMTLISSLATALFSLDDDAVYDRRVVRALHNAYARTPKSDIPGIFFLEIDGLAEPILREAIAAGYAPNMRRWIESGSHRLIAWEPDLSCQTSASQAGILLGSNENIPAFRWWDKASKKLMVSSSTATAQALELQLASDRGLLSPDGASRFNVFTGGASDCVATFAKLSFTKGGSNRYFSYLFNPYMLSRLVSRFVQDVFREWWEEFRQNQTHVEPRLNRPWKYALTRAATTSLMLEGSRFMLTADLLRGVPSVYCTLFAYDEVAHHTGVRSPYTLKVLRNIDRMFAQLEDVLERAPRPYHFVVLSDHGQSHGHTFFQRYGETLGDVVQGLVSGQAKMHNILDSQESLERFEAAVSEATNPDSRSRELVFRAVDGLKKESTVNIAGRETVDRKVGVLGDHQGYVLASGNLGLISFTGWPERMTYEQIVDAFPALIPGLVEHDGIGFVMVNSDVQGPIAIKTGGIYFLRDDTWDGINPLEPYGPLAAHHLRRTDRFAACPDLLVISTFWQQTSEVAAFEELIGNHGGLGGWQREPFVLFPKEFEAPTEQIIGAAHLNDVLRGWLDQVKASA